jgi:hypothetical protein
MFVKMKRIILIISIIIVLAAANWAQQTMTFEPYLPKSTFLLGEPIDFGMTLSNNSNSVIKELFVKIVSFRILNEQDKPLPYKGSIMYNMSGLQLTLKPAEKSYPTFNLIDLYGQEYKLVSPLFLHILVGKYTIEITFTPPNMEPQIIKVPFRVVEPEGEESEVYDSFMRMLRNKPTASEAVNTLESLYHKYPNSVYMPYFLSIIETFYKITFNDIPKALKVSKELIENYPSSNTAVELLPSVLKSMASDSERIEFMKKIQTKSKGTLMEERYGAQIQSIKEKEIK